MPLVVHLDSTTSPVFIAIGLFTLLAAIFYLRGCHKLRLDPDTCIPVSRIASFLTGLTLLCLATISPLAALDHHFLTAHMAKHLLLMTIAPALILLGDPLRSLLHAIPETSWRGTLVPAFSWSPIQRLGKFFSNPALCWFAATTALIVWHIPTIFSRALQSPALHVFEQITFVSAGFLFWWPVIQPWPASVSRSRWPILLYLFLATLPCDILSAYLTFCDRVVYPLYVAMPQASSFSALRDQELAGALMWASITLLYLIPAAVLTVRLLERPTLENQRPSPVLDGHAIKS